MSASHLWCVVLAGGVGSRFWPVSTPSRPKQLLPLLSDQPLIRETVDRILPLVPRDRLRILTGVHLAEPLMDVLPEFGPGNLLLEPRAAGTAPVLAWAASEIERRDPDAVMISLHADHAIRPAEEFRRVISAAAEIAVAHRSLVTIGAVPDRPETGFGYIRVGEPLQDVVAGRPGGAHRVAEFVEKPDAQRAARYLDSGEYLWNTGLFVWRAADLLDQLERHTPELADLVPILREGGTDEFFRRTPNLSIDHGLLERSDRVVVVRATFAWDDVGAWDGIGRSRTTDDAGNVSIGEAYPVRSKSCVLYSDEGPIVAFGVADLVVVRSGGLTFVTTKARAPHLKELLEELPESVRSIER